MGLDISRQPVKGIFFTAISIPAALGIWLLVHNLFNLDYGSSSLVITVCFAFFWQIAWSFGGWPANLVTENRWLRGTLNWLLLMGLVLLTIGCWHWYYGEPFQSTQIGVWGSTAIVAGVISLFFFGNTLLLPAEMGDRQPLSGFVNALWGLFLLPLGLLLLPSLAGNEGLYIPWIWFPITLVVMGYFGGWPFDAIPQPRAGIAYMAAVFAGTLAFLAVLKIAGTDFFSEGVGGRKGGDLRRHLDQRRLRLRLALQPVSARRPAPAPEGTGRDRADPRRHRRRLRGARLELRHRRPGGRRLRRVRPDVGAGQLRRGRPLRRLLVGLRGGPGRRRHRSRRARRRPRASSHAKTKRQTRPQHREETI